MPVPAHNRIGIRSDDCLEDLVLCRIRRHGSLGSALRKGQRFDASVLCSVGRR
jgi:hypothetical protein